MEIISLILITITMILVIVLILLINKMRAEKNENTNANDFAILGEKINNVPTFVKNELEKIILQELNKISTTLNESNVNNLKTQAENNEKSIKILSDNNEKVIEKFGLLETNLNKTLNSFNENFKSNLDKNIEKLIMTVEQRFEVINTKVEERLTTGFEKTNETFKNIIERLAKIDEAQKKIDSLSTNIMSLQDVLTDKKSRGIFGEVQLNQILNAVFGEPNPKIYAVQHKFKNETIADAVLFAPEPVGTIAIDSKFPLENYRRLMDRTLSEADKKIAETSFKSDMKKHIDAISSKYIIHDVTAEQAILFLPAEAIFAELNAYYGDIINYAQTKKVWIASPTTLMAVLNTLQIILKNAEREKYTGIIHKELNLLSQEFKRYETRWNSLAKDIEKVSNDVRDISITSTKISKKFTDIEKVEIDVEVMNEVLPNEKILEVIEE